jgi:hypothetical protein
LWACQPTEERFLGVVNAPKMPASPRLEPRAAELVAVSAFPQSIVLHCRVTLPFAELRQTLLLDAIDLDLHLGMPALDQDGEFTDQPARVKPVE